MSGRRDELADRLALRALVDEYGFAADARDRDRFCRLFAPGGELVARDQRGRVRGRHRGESGLAEVITEVLPQFGVTFHQVTNFGCELGGDAASGEAYCAAHHLRDPETASHALVMLIHYRDEYRRVGGSWLFGRREARVRWSERHEVLRGAG